MGRNYAGVLGCLAAAVIAVRGLRIGASPDSTLWAVACGVALFGMLGYIVGEIAAAAVADSVQQQLNRAMAEQQHSTTAPTS